MSFIASHLESSHRLIQRVDGRFRRFLYRKVDWRQRLIFIVGMRGVGKTTLLLQHLKLAFEPGSSRGLYITADDVNLSGVRLVDLADEFANRYGGNTLVIDEVHKYPDWGQELKNIFDLQPDLRVICSGSSSLSITAGQYDLSRRSLVHQLPHMSFREFLSLSDSLDHGPHDLEELLASHGPLSATISSALREAGATVLERFHRYLSIGAYPYSLGKDPFDYQRQLVNSITKVLYEDVPTTFDVASHTPVTLQRLLNLLTTSEPYQPNVESLARSLGIAKETTYNYLDYLEQSGLIAYLPKSRSGVTAVRKPEKIYLANPNVYAALGQVKGLKVQEGTLRESFFISQLGVGHRLTAHSTADFTVDGVEPRVFEVGGKGKSNKQLADVEGGYLALDDIEVGVGRRVPLWLFGFLY
jgi:predicted AAA+ superfamily ATPase